MIWPCAALLWGLAEATLFFIVPDVLLTLAAARFGWRPALRLCLLACSGAVVGGLAMRSWGAADIMAARAALNAIPAISPGMILAAGNDLAQEPAYAMLLAAFSGVPYKTFAVAAGAQGPDALHFALATVIARLPRFVIVVLVASAAARMMRRAGREAAVRPVWAVFWLLFYGFYFSVTPG